ncbi:MAG: AEC family transporter [Duodenibacillus sp.]|nr:AEC family transporter [Duodenibacillus sp.]
MLFWNTFLHHLALCAPLFSLVFIGWGLVKAGFFDASVSKALGKFVFKLLMPALLFKQLSKLSEMPPVDWRVLIAFFGACAALFIAGRLIGRRAFGLDSTGQVIMGMGAIFGNNVQLGIPIVQTSLGDASMPTISLLIAFNVLLLWSSATACVEFGRYGRDMDWGKFFKALLAIFRNPIVIGMMAGACWSFTGLALPQTAARTVDLVAGATTPCALLVVGMGLAEHSFGAALSKAGAITALKLAVQPMAVYALCLLLGLGRVQTHAATLLSALPVAINLYIMATQFESERGTASASIFVSTFISAFTVPLVLTLLATFG